MLDLSDFMLFHAVNVIFVSFVQMYGLPFFYVTLFIVNAFDFINSSLFI